MAKTSKAPSNSTPTASEDETVGYKKPPTATRFKPGQSGNPKGRPKGSRNGEQAGQRKLRDLILKEATRTIQVQQNGKIITMPSSEAVIRSITNRSIQGNPTAQKTYITLLKEVDGDTSDSWPDRLAILLNYKNGWWQAISEHYQRSISLQRPNPAPEDIIIDENKRTGYVIERSAKGTLDGDPSFTETARELTTQDYDWLSRNLPTPERIELHRLPPVFVVNDIRKLPHHMREAALVALRGMNDYQEGRILNVTPPKAIYDKHFITPSGHALPLSGRGPYAVTQEDAEALLQQGWTIIDIE